MNTSERKSYYDISSESSSNKRPFPFLARKRWKLIRDKIRKLKQSDQYISVAKPYSNRLFGYNLVKRSTSISTEQIEQISYVPDIKGRVVLVTSTSIKLYDLRDFSLTSELMIPMENENANRNPTPRYNRLAYASKMNLLIGWKPGGNSLFPLSVENFKNIGAPSTTKNPLVSVLSNSNSGSIISLELKSFSLFPNDEPCDKESEQTVSCPLLRKLLENYEFPSKLISFEENSNQNLRLLLGWKYSAWLRCIPCDDHFTSKYYDCGCDDDEKIFKSVDLKKFQQTAINHNSQISSVLFFTPLEILITGDICGTIKTWNIDQVQLAVFHSHLNEIIHFSTHRWDLIRPHSSQHISPSFISISRDGTMKCWQFWQSQCINPGDNQLISDDVQTNGTVRDVQTNSMMEVDSRKALMNLNSSILLENKYSHEVCGVCVKQHTGNIVLIGVKTKGDWKSESQTEYYLEHWTLSEPSSPLAEFPQTVRHISFVQLDEVYNVDDLELQQPNDCNQVEKADSINIAVVVCDGKPGSIHLISIPTGSIITTAICEDSAEDAVWHWMLEKLFVLQSNGTIAVFSTCSRPCSLLYVWKSAEDGAFYSGPLLLYPVHCPDYCKTILENKDSNDLQPQVILLFLVGTSNGSLAILCPQEGKILSKISTHLSTKTLDNPPDFSSSSPLSSIKSNPKSGRLYTVTVDGTIKVWQLIKPLPIIVQKKKIEDSDYDNANLRIHFKHFPFKIVNNTNIYCVYTAGDYSNTGRSKFPSDVSYYHTICAEVSDTWDNYSVSASKQHVV
uniref:Uncharacterized protein n=1 Tax=Trichobilharzia regenti TaxID=157069 RepID=A0AA85KGI3_TRIRE|nr:unnamed protein product [Trichobilharzia regenti]